MTRHWLLIHTKIGQEQTVLAHLQRQGHECFLPMAGAQVLFPRFVFIRLGIQPRAAGTRELALNLGMGPALSFRQTFIQVDDELMAVLRAHSPGGATPSEEPNPTKVASAEALTQKNATATSTVAAIYQMGNGEDRVLELLNLLSRRLKPQADASQTSTPAQWAAPLASPVPAALAHTSPV